MGVVEVVARVNKTLLTINKNAITESRDLAHISGNKKKENGKIGQKKIKSIY